MFDRLKQRVRPSLRWGLFHYIKPFDHTKTVKDMHDIVSKYSHIMPASWEFHGLNYLLTNQFINLEQADLLAKQLKNWRGRIFVNTLPKKTTYFTADHMDALIALIQDQRVEKNKAVAEIHLLTCDQARMIANGLTREEAENFSFEKKEKEDLSSRPKRNY